jgi:hypothetical protein
VADQCEADRQSRIHFTGGTGLRVAAPGSSIGNWSAHRGSIEARLKWLANLPFLVSLRGLSMPARAQEEAQLTGRREIKLSTASRAYVDPSRIAELQGLSSPQFDLRKLIRMCEEMNLCFAAESHFALIMLTRGVIDHVPPIFGCATFAEVANNYAGAKSFKEGMQQLESMSRKIADAHLHGQIRKSESLPNVTQIDFSNSLDVLLAEIARLLRAL